MAYILKGNLSNIMCGLNTATFAVMTTGPHFIRTSCTDVPPTGVIITVSTANLGTIGTSPSIDSSRQVTELHCAAYLTAGDVISVVISSASSLEADMPNNTKSLIVVNGQQNA
jgi:hypothetical protein